MMAAGLAIALGAVLIIGIDRAFARRKATRAFRSELPEWWGNPIPPELIRQTVRPIEASPPAELVVVRDPRVVRVGRKKRVAKQ